MGLSDNIDANLQSFVKTSLFSTRGAVITDLDGTAVHEFQGKIVIPKEVELGLMSHYKSGRQIVLNTLRFPLSVLRTFGQAWYNLSNAPIPVVTLNGSLGGYITRAKEAELMFREIFCFPLAQAEIENALRDIGELLEVGIKNVLVFYYPRDWRIGEVIWTPVPENVIPVKEKYSSASAVTAVEFTKLKDQMLGEEICMIFVLIDIPQDQLMAYQHTKRSNFITAQNIDKLTGARAMAEALNFDLHNSLGAGDTELDTFLSGVGMAVIVGNGQLPFRGLQSTVNISSSAELGALLFRSSELALQK